jgi:protease secretion system outer membrane protein
MTRQQSLLTCLLSGALLAFSVPACALDLVQAYRLALRNDMQLEVARAQAQAGDEALPQARSRLYPNVSYSRSRMNTTQNQINGAVTFPTQKYPSVMTALTLRQPLYNPRAWAQVDQSEASVQASQEALNAEFQSLSARVTEVYLSVMLAKERERLIDAQIKSTTARLDAAQRAFAAGHGIRTDIDEVQAQLDVLHANLLQARQALMTSAADFEMITGVALPTPFSMTFHKSAFDDFYPDPLAQWLDQAIRLSPDLNNKRAQRNAALAAVNVVSADHRPTLDAVVQDMHNSGENVYFVNSTTDSRSVGLQLNVPLYQGGYVNSRERQALANLKEAEAQLERAQQLTQNDVRKAYFALTEGVAQIRALDKALASAKVVLIANQKSFQAGVRTTLDILAAEQRLAEVSTNLVGAQVATLNAWVRLNGLVGQADEALIQTVSTKVTTLN